MTIDVRPPRDDGRTLLPKEDGRVVDLQELLSEMAREPLPEELSAEHATVLSMAAEVRASRDPHPRPRSRPAARPVTRAAVAAATVLITAGSSLAVTGRLPEPVREFASDWLAVIVPSRERSMASYDPSEEQAWPAHTSDVIEPDVDTHAGHGGGPDAIGNGGGGNGEGGGNEGGGNANGGGNQGGGTDEGIREDPNVVDDTIETVDDVVGDTVETVDQVVDDLIDGVGEGVDGLTDAVDAVKDTTDTVTDVVGGLLGG